jgi:hypothetical protein
LTNKRQNFKIIYMSQTITLPKSVFEELIERITRLEAAVFGKKEKIKEEYVKLSPAAKKRYKKMEEDIKKGKNIYIATSTEDFFKQLGI